MVRAGIVREDNCEGHRVTSVSRVAIVGCGAVIEQNYLPVFHAAAGMRCEVLVDPDRARIEELAARFAVPHVAASLDAVTATIDGVIVAVPNDLHLPVATAAFDRGLDVLCEKPVARTGAEAAAMASAAVTRGRRLYAAMVCRRFPAVAEVVAGGQHRLVGELQRVEASYGVPIDWPVRSASFYDRARVGGGVLLDLGVHLIDALLYVLGDPASEVVGYADDGDTGVETEAEARIVFCLAHRRVDGLVRTSRQRRLPNTIVLHGANGRLTIPLNALQPAILSLANGDWPVTGRLPSAAPCFVAQLEDFGRALRGETHALPSGDSQVSRHELIDRLYAVRTPYVFPWDVPSAVAPLA